MDIKKLYLAMVFVITGGLASAPAKAQALYCDTVSTFIGAAAGAGIGASVNAAVSAGLAAVGANFGDSVLSERCQRSLEEFGEYYRNNPVNHITFVRDHCDGNPLNCPGNLNIHDPWHDFPSNCQVLLTCGAQATRDPATTGPFNSISVNDLINGMTFVDISISYGYWATADYGYLVGLDGGYNNYEP